MPVCGTLVVVTNLGSGGRVGLLKQGPDSRSDAVPTIELAVLVGLLDAEPLHDFLLGESVGVEVESVEYL